MEIIDITAEASPRIVHRPGTEPPRQEWLSRTDRGDPNPVSEWTLNSHTGTHMDARMHFVPGGWTMESLDLDRCVGPCQVVDPVRAGDRITRADLESAGIAGQQRVLLKTRNSADDLLRREKFEESYTAISAEVASYLVEIGVRTVGIDYLSVEPFEDTEFRTHHTLLEADVGILEGLLLQEAAPGDYLLACLPLKLAGSDGAPARAVLIDG